VGRPGSARGGRRRRARSAAGRAALRRCKGRRSRSRRGRVRSLAGGKSSSRQGVAQFSCGRRRCLPFEGPSPPRPSSPRGRGGRKKSKICFFFVFLPPLPRGEEGRGGEGPSKGRHRRLPQEN